MSRTSIAIGVIATAALSSVTCTGLANAHCNANGVGSLRYKITRNEKTIGEISVLAQTAGKTLTICSNTSIQVKTFGFLASYRLSSSDEERWSDDSLTLAVSHSVTKGVMHDLTGKIEGPRFSFRLDKQNYEAPTSLGTTSFWRRADITKAALLNLVTGQLMAAPEQVDLGFERRSYGSLDVYLHHYRLMGSLERDIWYDEDRLSQLTYKAIDGSIVSIEIDR